MKVKANIVGLLRQYNTISANFFANQLASLDAFLDNLPF